MTKEETLAAVRALSAQGQLTKEEVFAAIGATPPAATPAPTTQGLSMHLGIADLMYYIGGAIVCIGIAIFVGQNWEILSFPAKMLATLGAGLTAYIVAVLLGQQERFQGPSAAFYLISAIVTPVGLYVMLDNAGWNMGDTSAHLLISTVMFVLFMASFLLARQTVLALFSIMFGTWLFYAVTDKQMEMAPIWNTDDFFAYRALLSGVVYMMLGYALREGRHAALTGALYGFGVLGFLGAALVLGGWEPRQNAFWELIFPLLVFGILYASVYLKSRSFLVFGTLFLIAYIFKITGEYFADGFGWPLALVIAGLLTIGAGSLSVSLNRKYLKS